MSLSRSPSPVQGGGWASPGLNINSGRSSPAAQISGGHAKWDPSKMRRHHNGGSNNYPSFSTQNSGFFTRHMRQISSSLPRFSNPPNSQRDKRYHHHGSSWAGGNVPLLGRLRSIFGRLGRKLKWRLLFTGILFVLLFIFYNSSEC